MVVLLVVVAQALEEPLMLVGVVALLAAFVYYGEMVDLSPLQMWALPLPNN